ncbi:helix-turn-helix transcriptional regulator [Brevibacillus sp. HB1.2]|uniref:helix-turn-helix domain-containing protein n=1 Tax=Brevibacillus TaxID=55080 RepID=UPI0009E3A007|nr:MULTISPECIES: helix-turn-helix transcriptional regulator [unclassified Brevibacillus]ATF14041.1 XRE family transcriptional regulator [Brevibacillus brevis X23]NRS19126.1 helix-turn-helix transcriptional regulator [Brevibacillus sp. HB1.4B]NTU22300.1 helix-turn-helix transcriptional regulator [Brevibacillus sp. HB1.2]NTU28824.1 helix-turn-helix transcriptional regulator [Brevibacillus sp. HB1.1]
MSRPGTNLSHTQYIAHLSRSHTSASTFEYVSLDVLDKLCNHLDCRIEDIIEHVPDNK